MLLSSGINRVRQYSIQNVKSTSMVFCSHALILHLMQLEWTGALIRLPDLGYDCKFSKL